MTTGVKEKMDLLVTGLGCCRTDIRISGGELNLPYLALRCGLAQLGLPGVERLPVSLLLSTYRVTCKGRTESPAPPTLEWLQPHWGPRTKLTLHQRHHSLGLKKSGGLRGRFWLHSQRRFQTTWQLRELTAVTGQVGSNQLWQSCTGPAWTQRRTGLTTVQNWESRKSRLHKCSRCKTHLIE